MAVWDLHIDHVLGPASSVHSVNCPSNMLPACVLQVLHRQALVKSRDVVEVDCWGMDCYTRRNVFDAVLQADVFKHFRGTQEQQQQEQDQGEEAPHASQQQLVKAEFEQKQPAGDVVDAEQTVDLQAEQQAAAEVGLDKPAEGLKQETPPPAQQQPEAMPEQQQKSVSPSPAPEAAAGIATQQQMVQVGREGTGADDGSPESGVVDVNEPEDAQRKSKRARKRVVYADDAMEELKVGLVSLVVKAQASSTWAARS